MSLLFDRLCENRGYDAQFFDDIFSAEHSFPMHVDALAHQLYMYRLSYELIVVLTDFDLDGICAGVIAYGGLSELGFNVSLYCPDTTKGYGFNRDTIDDLVSKFPKVKAILTGDVGISCKAGIARAKELGLDIFVTDHHIGSHDTGADVTVDPNCPEEEGFGSYPFVCGSVVMYDVLHYYAEHYTQNPGYSMQQIDRLRAFAGFATVSDSMPVYHENRDFIKDAVSMCQFLYGQKSLEFLDSMRKTFGSPVYQRMFYGLYEVLRAFDEAGKFLNVWSIDEDFFGFYLAPAFNSIKRMEYDVNLAYSIFFGGTDEAKRCIRELLALNEQRKELVEQKLLEISETEQPWAPYAYLTDAPGGIRGLLAQKLMNPAIGPVLVLEKESDGVYRGSGRSPEWYPFLDTSGNGPKGAWGAAGHNPAFGVHVDSDEALNAFVMHIDTMVTMLKPSDEELEFVPDFVIGTVGECDSDIDVDNFKAFLHDVRLCRPFGPGFPKHQALLRFRSSEAAWMLLGEEKNHVKLMLPGGLQVLCFHQGEPFHGNIQLEYLPEVIEVVGGLSYNEFRGVTSVQFMGTFMTDIFENYPDEPIVEADGEGIVIRE